MGLARHEINIGEHENPEGESCGFASLIDVFESKRLSPSRSVNVILKTDRIRPIDFQLY